MISILFIAGKAAVGLVVGALFGGGFLGFKYGASVEKKAQAVGAAVKAAGNDIKKA